MSRDGERDGGARPRTLLLMGPELASLIIAALEHGQYVVRIASTAPIAASVLAEWTPHLLIADLDNYGKLLDVAGRGTLQDQRPILALTRKRDTSVKLAAFERGIDDIIEVPFTLDQIVGRAYALMRRAHHIQVPIVPRVKLDSLEVDLLEQRVLIRDGRRLSLSALQQMLLYLLAANAGKVMTRDAILATIWGSEFEAGSNIVDRHIRELRVALDDDWRAPLYIETVPGEGYRFRSGNVGEEAPK
jgi:DNA-binding response OmpR family regulator